MRKGSVVVWYVAHQKVEGTYGVFLEDDNVFVEFHHQGGGRSTETNRDGIKCVKKLSIPVL